MTINQYVKKWCDESYDVRKEDFFVANAKYISEREWAKGGITHGIFGIVFAMIAMAFSKSTGVLALVDGLSILGVSAVCFWFFGIRRFDSNSTEISTGLYLSLAFVLVGLLQIVPITYKVIFTIPTIVLYVYQSIVRPFKFKAVKADMKKRMEEMAAEDDEKAQQAHARWESQYKSYRYGIPESTTATNDPMMEEARKLFVGFTENMHMLKTRYRQMAKQYHPDVGGDTKMFQCIVSVYEELCQQLA